jgi:opacity protein-like surface antigen
LGLAAAVGYGMGQVRVEGEISYQKSDFDKISVPGASADATGDMSSIAFLINGYFDFVNSTAFTPYISVGVGYAQIDLNDFNYPGSGEPDYNSDDSVFAYQFGVGAGYAVTEKVIIDLKYRYFATDDPEFDGIEAEASSHNVILGVRFYF